ncbi:hypothetical protein [Sphingomonas sp.]|uniref:hypothetical protein n=1 Tax=Sphingomonas sp. TaxID=28214 RepID=UPI003F6EBA18
MSVTNSDVALVGLAKTAIESRERVWVARAGAQEFVEVDGVELDATEGIVTFSRPGRAKIHMAAGQLAEVRVARP